MTSEIRKNLTFYGRANNGIRPLIGDIDHRAMNNNRGILAYARIIIKIALLLILWISLLTHLVFVSALTAAAVLSEQGNDLRDNYELGIRDSCRPELTDISSLHRIFEKIIWIWTYHATKSKQSEIVTRQWGLRKCGDYACKPSLCHCLRNHDRRRRRTKLGHKVTMVPKYVYLDRKSHVILGDSEINSTELSRDNNANASLKVARIPGEDNKKNEKHEFDTSYFTESSHSTHAQQHTLTSTPIVYNELRTMAGTDSNGTDAGFNTPASTSYIIGALPRPGQPGAPFFDNTNLTEFLRRWDIECEDAKLTDKQKCARLPDYCTPKTKDVVELLDGYKTLNWNKLKEELRGLFWQYDKQKNSPNELDELILDAPNLDLSVYVLKYAAISDALVKEEEMSLRQRVRRFLDGLPSDLRDKAFDFCIKQDWKLSAGDPGSKEPDFDELEKFISGKAQLAQRKIVYNRERAIMARDPTHSSAKAPSTSTKSADPITTTNADSKKLETFIGSMDDLTHMMSKLTLAITGKDTQLVPKIITTLPQTVQQARQIRPLRCVWCDSLEHLKGQCPELAEALRLGIVHLNSNNRVVNATTGEEVPPMFGRGGMRTLFEQKSAIPVNNSNITAEPYGHIDDEGAIRVIALDEAGNIIHEVVEVEEKRKRDNEWLPRNVRLRSDNVPKSPASAIPPQFERTDTKSNESAITMPPTSGVPISNAETPKQVAKFRLASDLQEQVSVDDIGEKIMDMPVSLPLREVFGMSPDISNWFSERSKRRRKPLGPTTTSSVNTVTGKPLYACPSGRAKVLVDGQLTVSALLDHGSEINIMSRRMFDRLGIPIDTDISWHINAYNAEKPEEANGCIGVCHDVCVSIGGIEAHIPIFVVEKSVNDLLLGRPWERVVRAQYINEDDGSVTVKIKSLDGRRIAMFTAVKGDHERNREFARRPFEGSIGGDPLKV